MVLRTRKNLILKFRTFNHNFDDSSLLSTIFAYTATKKQNTYSSLSTMSWHFYEKSLNQVISKMMPIKRWKDLWYNTIWKQQNNKNCFKKVLTMLYMTDPFNWRKEYFQFHCLFGMAAMPCHFSVEGYGFHQIKRLFNKKKEKHIIKGEREKREKGGKGGKST